MKQIDYETAINQLMVAGNEEMQVRQQTIRNYIKKMEEKKNGTDHSSL